jgi:hypothetical protein
MGPDVDAMRKTMRKLVLPGQHRIHMAKERDARRKEIADAIRSAGVSATIYDAGRRYGNELDARAACLEAIIADINADQPTLLVIEQDDSLIRWDKQRLIELVRASGCHDTLRYEHHRAKSELLLTVPDAISPRAVPRGAANPERTGRPRGGGADGHSRRYHLGRPVRER